MIICDVFSSRELAAGFWIIALIIFLFINNKTRKPAFGVIKALLSKHLLLSFICIILYASVFTIFFSKLSVWEWIYLKDIIIWVLFAGVPICLRAIDRKQHDKFFREMLFDNIKFTVFVEFVVSMFTFHIFAELVIFPLFTFLFMLYIFVEMKEENKSAQNVITGMVIIAILVLLVFTIKEAVVTYRDVGIVDMFIGFCIPIAFSILYIPFAYIFSIFAKYQMLFIRMKFKCPDDNKLKRKYRRMAFFACGLSYQRIIHFENEVLKNMYSRMDDDYFKNMISKFKMKTGMVTNE